MQYLVGYNILGAMLRTLIIANKENREENVYRFVLAPIVK